MIKRKLDYILISVACFMLVLVALVYLEKSDSQSETAAEFSVQTLSAEAKIKASSPTQAGSESFPSLDVEKQRETKSEFPSEKVADLLKAFSVGAASGLGEGLDFLPAGNSSVSEKAGLPLDTLPPHEVSVQGQAPDDYDTDLPEEAASPEPETLKIPAAEVIAAVADPEPEGVLAEPEPAPEEFVEEAIAPQQFYVDPETEINDDFGYVEELEGQQTPVNISNLGFMTPGSSGSTAHNFSIIASMMVPSGNVTYSSFQDNGDGTITVDGYTMAAEFLGCNFTTFFDGNLCAEAEGGGRAREFMGYPCNPTATGILAQRGVVAVNDSRFPYGTVFFIEGYGLGVNADTGNFSSNIFMDLSLNPRECVNGMAEAMGGSANRNIYVISIP